MEKIRRAVQRINNPNIARVLAFDAPTFLHQKTIIGPSLFQFTINNALGFHIGGRYKVGRPFPAHLKVLDFSEISNDSAAGLFGGLGHHVD